MENNDWEPTIEEVLDWIDPDWSGRWQGDADSAAKYYQTYGAREWMEAVRELRGDATLDKPR